MATEHQIYFGKDAYQSIMGTPSPKEANIGERLENVFVLQHGDLSNIPEEYHQGLFDGVSEMIGSYTTAKKTEGEMLPKTPDEIRDIFITGNSTIMVHKIDDDHYEPIAHAAMWPLIQHENLSIYEFGSWIVADDYRHKRLSDHMTIGEEIAVTARQEVINRDEKKGFVVSTIATVKRLNSLKGLIKAGFEPVRFTDSLVVSTATCTCNTSDNDSPEHACYFRRGENNGEDSGPFSRFIHITKPNGNGGSPKIPCTLVTDDVYRLNQIEHLLESEYQELVGVSLDTSGIIDHESKKQAHRLFEILGISL